MYNYKTNYQRHVLKLSYQNNESVLGAFALNQYYQNILPHKKSGPGGSSVLKMYEYPC